MLNEVRDSLWGMNVQLCRANFVEGVTKKFKSELRQQKRSKRIVLRCACFRDASYDLPALYRTVAAIIYAYRGFRQLRSFTQYDDCVILC